MSFLHCIFEFPIVKSFVDNPNDKINIAVWDEGNSDVPLGVCSRPLPNDPNYDQRMITEWIQLTSADGSQPRGKIKVGVHYIYDQVLLLETLLDKRQEERKQLDDDLKYTQDTLDKTSGPFELLINPNYNVKTQEVVTEATPGKGLVSATFGKVHDIVSEKVGAAEMIIGGKANAIKPPGMKWAQVTMYVAFLYAFLSGIVAFAKEDFLNVFFT